MNNSKLGNIAGTIGLLGGIMYAMKKNKGLGATSLYALGFGIGGLLLGNAITKFYE
jgi:hypothetical protein